jgi:hypothetical protein
VSDKPRQVDLGPMYLPLGEERQRPVTPTPKAVPASRRDDVDRFRELMRRSPAAFVSPGLVAPVSLLARRDEDDPPHSDEGEHRGFIDAMERLWVSEGLHGEREVRIGLRNQILPDTAVRLRTLEGHLQIDLSCLDGRVARQLASQLESLARELGSRLDRPVVATVEHLDHGLLRSVSWFPGQT